MRPAAAKEYFREQIDEATYREARAAHQSQPRGDERVRSRSNPQIAHFVNLEERKCSCPANYFGKKFCYHLRVARWAKWLQISIAEVIARLAEVEEHGGCGQVTCSPCVGASSYPCVKLPESQTAFARLVAYQFEQSFSLTESKGFQE